MSASLLDSFGERLLLVGAIAIYYLIFIWGYGEFLAPLQHSWGFSEHEIPPFYQLLNWVMVITPALWLPLRLERPSMLLFLLQYVLLFIPATIVIYNSSLPVIDPDKVCLLVVTLFGALSMWQAIYYLPLLRLRARGLSAPLFWSIAAVLTVTLFVLVVVVLGKNFALVDFNKVYQLRFAEADLATGVDGQLALRAQMWLMGVVLPLLFALGLLYRKPWVYLVVTAGYVFLFGIAGAKSAVLGVPILSMIALWMRGGPTRAPTRFVLGATLLLLVPVLLSGDDRRSEFLLHWYVDLVHSRIFAMQALITGQYYAFFQDHPYTLWSHITGIGAFISYPYETDMSRTIGEFYYTVNVGTNAGMWASDGMAALGLAGVIVITAVAAPLLWLFDSVAQRHSIRFVVVALGFLAINFANIPLPTMLLSGGGLLMAGVLYFMPPVVERRVRVVQRPAVLAAH